MTGATTEKVLSDCPWISVGSRTGKKGSYELSMEGGKQFPGGGGRYSGSKWA